MLHILCGLLFCCLKMIRTAEAQVWSKTAGKTVPYEARNSSTHRTPRAVVAEISATPQEHFSSSERLCSWGGTVPRNDESAGKVKSKRTKHGNSYVKAILCQSAWAAVSVRNSPFRAWFWSHKSKLGEKKAIIAVARKLLKLIYLLLSTGQLYQAPIPLQG